MEPSTSAAMQASSPSLPSDMRAGDTPFADFSPSPPRSQRIVVLSPDTKAKRGVAQSCPSEAAEPSDRFRLAVWRYSHENISGHLQHASALQSVLPHEVMLHIFAFLPLYDVAVASQASKSWFVAMDPWAFLEHHAWIPLGAITRARSISVRFAADDENIANAFLSSCISCKTLNIEMGSHSPTLPLRGTPLERELPFLEEISLQKPAPEDLHTVATCVLCRTPSLVHFSLNRMALPIGARALLSIRHCSLRRITLAKVGHISTSTLFALFRNNPSLQEVKFERCSFVTGHGQKAKLSCTVLTRGALEVVDGIVHTVTRQDGTTVSPPAAPASSSLATKRRSVGSSPLSLGGMFCPTCIVIGPNLCNDHCTENVGMLGPSALRFLPPQPSCLPPAYGTVATAHFRLSPHQQSMHFAPPAPFVLHRVGVLPPISQRQL